MITARTEAFLTVTLTLLTEYTHTWRWIWTEMLSKATEASTGVNRGVTGVTAVNHGLIGNATSANA